MTTSENIKEIKHSFLAFRNGIVSDTLRKAGMPYGIIFGLQLPQLAEIARRYDKSVGKGIASAGMLSISCGRDRL